MQDMGAIGNDGQRIFQCPACKTVKMGTTMFSPECECGGKGNGLRADLIAHVAATKAKECLRELDDAGLLVKDPGQACEKCGLPIIGQVVCACPRCGHENGKVM